MVDVVAVADSIYLLAGSRLYVSYESRMMTVYEVQEWNAKLDRLRYAHIKSDC